jgi:hypothetical protein
VIQLIAYTPLPTANTTICHIHTCSDILIDITGTKLTLKLLYMQTQTNHPLPTAKYRTIPFVKPMI